MGFCNTRALQRANSYEDCLDLFAKISKPRGSGWSENERPLGSKYQRHYRVERRYNGDWFDVILYHTTMARFYKPEADGSYRVQYSWDSRTTSSQFMYHVVHVNQVEEYRDAAGTPRYVPLGEGKFATDLWIDVDGRLDVTRSHHSQAFKPVVSEEFKAWRKEFTAHLSNICFLMEQTVQETIATHEPDADEGRPFCLNNSIYPLRGWDGRTIDAETIEGLRTIYERATRALMDKRAYNAQPKSIWSRSSGKGIPYIDPTPQEVTRSVLARLEAGTWAPKKYDKAPLPMFPEELPANWHF